MSKHDLSGGNVWVSYDADASAGKSGSKGCVVVEFRDVGMTLSLSFTDAEQLAEAIIKCVRIAEEKTSCST